MSAPPRDPPAGDAEPTSHESDVLEQAARARRSVAETIARVRKLTAGIGAPSDSEPGEDADPATRDAPSGEAAAAPADAGHDLQDHDDHHRLTGDVSALLDRTRGVIERTRRLLDESRRESAERTGE